jgi:PAS domain S-box-containing protein
VELINYALSEGVYLGNLVFTVGYACAMLIYLSRHDTRAAATRALQRLLIGVISWAFYDSIMIRISQTVDPHWAFFWFRALSFMWLAIGGLSADLVLSLIRPVTLRVRIILYAPYVLMYLAHLALPQYTTGFVYGIPGGWPSFPAPWHLTYQAIWVLMFIFLGILLWISASQELDPRARRERWILFIGIVASMTLLLLSRHLLKLIGPGFPALGNTSIAIFALAAFISLSRYGRVLSPQTLYRVTANNIPSGVAHVHQGRITWANQALARMVGVSGTDALTGRALQDLLQIEATEGQTVQPLLAGGAPAAEVGLRGAPGSRFLVTSVPVDPQAPQQGSLFVFTDITQQKRVEEALKESESKFYNAFLSNPAAITINRLEDGTFIDVNQAFTDTYGYSREEAIGSSSRKMGIWAGLPEQEEQRRRLLEKHGRVRHFEFIFRRKNGELGTGLNFAEIIELGGRPHVLSMSIDITDRKQAEDELRKSEERYRAVLDASSDPIVVYDMKGICLYANAAFSRVFGWTLDEVVGRRIDYVPPESEAETKKHIGYIVEGQSFYGFETRRYTQAGNLIDVSMSAAVIRDRQGQSEGSVINLQDITERKKAEAEREQLQAQLRQSQKMEAIGTLASGVAHDFNNILQAISGNIQIMAGHHGSDAGIAHHAREIETAVQRAADLVQRLLTFSRKVEPEFNILDLNREVREAVGILERIIPKMISIDLQLAEDIDPIRADDNQVYQVLMNLGTNARDAMPQGGQLGFVTRNLTMDRDFCERHVGTTPGRYVLMTVSDTGHGMDEETLKHIYTPFFTTKEVGKGTGLGLAMVYGIVKNHGGYVRCDSRPGRGTTFSVYWPVISQVTAAEAHDLVEDNDITGGHEKILVVDDERAILEIAEDLLTENGYIVLTAGSGEEALQVFQEFRHQIDLVVLDLGMPGIGGHRTLTELRKIDPQVKVIISSGYSSDGKVKEDLWPHVAGFMDKPYRLHDMLKKVRDVLDN